VGVGGEGGRVQLNSTKTSAPDPLAPWMGCPVVSIRGLLHVPSEAWKMLGTGKRRNSRPPIIKKPTGAPMFPYATNLFVFAKPGPGEPPDTSATCERCSTEDLSRERSVKGLCRQGRVRPRRGTLWEDHRVSGEGNE